MSAIRRFATLAVFVLASAAPARAQVVLDWSVDASLSLDAGAQHWFVNLGGPQVAGTGLVTQAVSDTVGGGAQAAVTSAYASLGTMGGLVHAEAGAFALSSGQGFNDLSWSTDLLITGTPGTRVALLMGAHLEGELTGSGLGQGSSVSATTWVANAPLADWRFQSVIAPGPFDAFTSRVYEFDVGSVVRVTSRLTVAARAEGLELTTSSATANALNTSTFHVDVLTPGGGYIAGGGVVFQPLSAVPEPAAAWLLAAALPLLLLRRRRR